ncbi:MAG: tetratricopeptide repeat protein [Candidatus Margulisbacteria bacterium]|nr:tetratricopeptide repeat protein [Candidatus Margulisiibacteriota bacterium]
MSIKPVSSENKARDLSGILREGSFDRAEKLHNLGIDSLNNGDFFAAIEYFKKALECFPELIETINALGVTYLFIDDIAMARACFARVLKKILKTMMLLSIWHLST